MMLLKVPPISASYTMSGRVFAIVYESLRIVSPSTVNRATWRTNPVIRLTMLASAITLLERPRDGSALATRGNWSVGSSSAGGPVTGWGRGADPVVGGGRR